MTTKEMIILLVSAVENVSNGEKVKAKEEIKKVKESIMENEKKGVR